MKIKNLFLSFIAASGLWAQDAPQVQPLELPLPGGQVMRFIPVEVTSDSNLFSGRVFNIGSATNVNEPIAEVRVSGTVYDRTTETWYIPFCETEVTNAQYAAVMGTPPPAKGTENLPKVNISVSEISAFMSRLSVLMLQNPEFMTSLARYNNDKTTNFYFRLPTPVEWEFAARGGCAVNSSLFDSDYPYPVSKIASYEALFDGNPRNKKVRAVKGRRKANPVGLYDMLGNVSEMAGPLHYFDGRLGRTGGIPVCGGSFNTPKDTARASFRIECSPFNEKGEEYRSSYVGFRPVMGSTIRHKKMSLELFQQQWEEHVQTVPPLTTNPGDISSDQVESLLIQQLEEKVKEKEKALAETSARVQELEQEIKSLTTPTGSGEVSDAGEVRKLVAEKLKHDPTLLKEVEKSLAENEKLKKERNQLRKQLASARAKQKDVDALRKRVDIAERKTQEALALVRQTEVLRVQAGITILMTSSSEISYFVERAEGLRKVLERAQAEEPEEYQKEVQDAIALNEANISAAENYLRKGCEILVDTPAELVEAELEKQLKALQKNPQDHRLYVCLKYASEYYKEYRKTNKHHSTDTLKEKLISNE